MNELALDRQPHTASSPLLPKSLYCSMQVHYHICMHAQGVRPITRPAMHTHWCVRRRLDSSVAAPDPRRTAS